MPARGRAAPCSDYTSGLGVLPAPKSRRLFRRHLLKLLPCTRGAQMVIRAVLDPGGRHAEPVRDDRRHSEVEAYRAAVAMDDRAALFVAYHACISTRCPG